MKTNLFKNIAFIYALTLGLSACGDFGVTRSDGGVEIQGESTLGIPGFGGITSEEKFATLRARPFPSSIQGGVGIGTEGYTVFERADGGKMYTTPILDFSALKSEMDKIDLKKVKGDEIKAGAEFPMPVKLILEDEVRTEVEGIGKIRITSFAKQSGKAVRLVESYDLSETPKNPLVSFSIEAELDGGAYGPITIRGSYVGYHVELVDKLNL